MVTCAVFDRLGDCHLENALLGTYMMGEGNSGAEKMAGQCSAPRGRKKALRRKLGR